ncbi:hypothetical protein [Streptomyces beijiangensis]|uniref:Uncharacterized protein n=1 Tax=Streptomyces beijiangensis TaxID=163361 RepID=A0A939F7U5_9ACTN|nr:hypothetical protein [Streptomyces beijiangensis]MBO0514191.1 hypothetical protein [Streptomyces beijiangensis]
MKAALVPVDAHVLDQAGEYVGELLVWTDRGATLAALEYAWVTDEMPTSLPPVGQVKVTVSPAHRAGVNKERPDPLVTA